MKLNSIILQNFKGIDNLEIKLDNKTTVIFGVNGVGKSTILQAIDLLYADIIAKLMGTVRSKTARFNEDFISYGKSAAGIKADFDFGDGESIYYERTIDRAKGEKRNTSALKKLTDKFQSLYIQMGYDDGNGNSSMSTTPEPSKGFTSLPGFANAILLAKSPNRAIVHFSPSDN